MGQTKSLTKTITDQVKYLHLHSIDDFSMEPTDVSVPFSKSKVLKDKMFLILSKKSTRTSTCGCTRACSFYTIFFCNSESGRNNSHVLKGEKYERANGVSQGSALDTST